MTMVPMIERKDAFGKARVTASVRDDLIREYVACVPCRGSGCVSRYAGGGHGVVYFNLYHCTYCGGAGIWQDRSARRTATG